MTITDITKFEDEFVIHFGSETTRINAYTLASTLINISDAAKAANAIINPGYGIEIVVEAIAPGSFKVKIKPLYNSLRNLFSAENLKAIILAIVANFIFHNTITNIDQPKIIINDDSVIYETADQKIIVPRYIYDEIKKVESSKDINNSINKMLIEIKKDEKITSIGISNDFDTEDPSIKLPSKLISEEVLIYEEYRKTRSVSEKVNLLILKAILERNTKRKWEFVWRNNRISAPVLDHNFFDEFYAHRITIAPGDILEATITIHQKYNEEAGVFINDKYEVTEVSRHVPRAEQKSYIE